MMKSELLDLTIPSGTRNVSTQFPTRRTYTYVFGLPILSDDETVQKVQLARFLIL